MSLCQRRQPKEQLKVPSHATNLCSLHNPCRHWSLQPLNYCILYIGGSQQRGVKGYQNHHVAFLKYTSFHNSGMPVPPESSSDCESCLGDSDTIIQCRYPPLVFRWDSLMSVFQFPSPVPPQNKMPNDSRIQASCPLFII